MSPIDVAFLKLQEERVANDSTLRMAERKALVDELVAIGADYQSRGSSGC